MGLSFTKLVQALSAGYGWAAMGATSAYAAYNAAQSTLLATITGKRTGATLSTSLSQTVVSGDTLVMGAGTGSNGFTEGGTYPVWVTQTANGQTNKQRLPVTVLPAGVTWGGAWTPFVSDLWVANGWLQEDLADGAVASWTARGAKAAVATQGTGANQPTKIAGAGGVEFSAASAHYLTWPNDTNRYASIRGTLTVFKLDPTSGTGGDTILCAPNNIGTGTNQQSSALRYTKGGNAVRAIWNDSSGLQYELDAAGITPNYSTWAFVVHYHRDGKLYAKFNGQPAVMAGTDQFEPARNQTGGDTGFFGHTNNGTNGGVKWALDCRLDLMGDLSDAFIAKLEWWAAQRAGISLPVGHAYASSAPVVDIADFPLILDKWLKAEWDLVSAAKAARDSSRLGQPYPAAVWAKFSEPVFLDDFRVKSVVNSSQALTDGIWYALGGLAGNTIGGNATLLTATQTPDCYPYDAGNQTLGVRAARVATAQLRAGAMSTVDLMDNGITFGGYSLYHVRFKLALTGTKRDYFPCPMWFYSNQRAKHGELLTYEIDSVEIDFANGDTNYMNGMSHLAHPGVFYPGYNGRPAADATGQKMSAAFMTTANGWPSNIDLCDGAWHDVHIAVDEDTTYFALDGFEVVRWATQNMALSRMHMIVNNCIRNAPTSQLVDGDQLDCIIDQIDVWKLPSEIAKVPAPFTARPTISGTAYPGSVLTVTPNVSGVSQLRYEWYDSDGYPQVTFKGATFVPSTANAGKRIRCRIIATSHPEQPEIWSLWSDVVQSGATISSADLNFASNSYTVNGVVYGSFAAAQAAFPGLGFSRDSDASYLDPVNAFTVSVGRHTLRRDATRGLLYEGEYGKVPFAPSPTNPLAWVPSTARVTYGAVDGPLGTATGHGLVETGALGNPQLTIPIGNIASTGTRVTAVVLVKANTRYLAMQASSGVFGSSITYYDLQAGGMGALNGATASIVSLGGGWYILHWSRTATGTGSASLFITARATNNGTTYTGTDGQVAFYIAAANVVQTPKTQIKVPHLLNAPRAADVLTLPLGSTPRTLTATVYDPVAGSASTQTISSVSGDYAVTGLNQPFLQRLQF